VDLGLTYLFERAKMADLSCGCFWLKGGAVDAAVTLYRGLGAAAVVSGQHASNLANGVSVGTIDYAVGPRYTMAVPDFAKVRSRLYAQALFGGAHGFDGIFPGSNGVSSQANSTAFLLGGGLDIAASHGFSVRAIEVSFHRTNLPNSQRDSQDDLRLSFGISYRPRSH
jgi:hypothetical protein